MVSLETPVCDFGKPAIEFSLRGVDSKTWTLDDCRGENGLLVMFICNHCPYVKAIMSNDPADYPQDSFDQMQDTSRQQQFSFPYLFDETQQIAQKFGAVCTPDFFGYNKELQLQYRGRFDESKKLAAASDVRRDLFEAMKLVAETGRGPEKQIPSMGCSIKWRAA